MWERAPEYFSRWRIFPRIFISMYIYLLWKVSVWFMNLPAPTMEQAGFVSVIVGSGAAWFGLYVNSGNGFKVDAQQSYNVPNQSEPKYTQYTGSFGGNKNSPG